MPSPFFALLLLCPSLASAAIFGADDRAYVNEGSPYRQEGRATAVAVLSSNLEANPDGTYRLNTSSMSEFVCPEERFARDPSLAYACTGFLVAPNLIATAGHCMVNTGESRNETDTYCQAFAWMFDYQRDTSGEVNLTQVPAEKVYRCKQVIYAVKDEKAPFRDYALVELERPVADREPVKLSPRPVDDYRRFSMVGHPLGTPAKLSRDARMLLNHRERESFLTSLDAFEGNSGSPVFDQDRQVVGILVGGTPMNGTVTMAGKSCQRYNRCDDQGRNCLVPDSAKDISQLPGYMGVGSEVQRIGPVIELIRAFRAGKAQ